ncbi:response regulator [Candidatus Bathyarchaeota archaeon]|nr:response regulator [Candidatus Bathyarchaeota archaeon]MBS7629252.1 response regulator [Candidatus Bathyarchaeota archaeon]
MDKKRILVVEDDQTILKSIREILELEGYIVDTADRGEEAVKKSETNIYNLALIDIRLPDMDGTKLLSMLKETTPKMSKIILTGYPSMESAIEAVNKGADGYLVKPIDMDTLLNKVKEQLRRQEEEMKYSEEKVKEFVERRIKELESQDIKS